MGGYDYTTFILIGFPIALAVVPLAVAVILRLCEWSWEKPAGSMGSQGLFAGSALFVLPSLAVLGLWYPLIRYPVALSVVSGLVGGGLRLGEWASGKRPGDLRSELFLRTSLRLLLLTLAGLYFVLL
jgi:hypothetical protein